ncbi:hypothetical protein BDF14DRAFT_1807063 [Spinellus fusiger]|nr:hypothetical protein BDF14DRAFT_1807063 [Spinellus fusiger]
MNQHQTPLFHQQMSKEEKEESTLDVDNILFKKVKILSTYIINDKARICEQSEATFLFKHLMPVIKEVLLSETGDKTIYAVIDRSISNGKRPDFMLGTTTTNNNNIFVFFVEVKRPNTTSCYQEEDDFTKLLKQMKLSIDSQLYLGVKDPFSLGLLLKGHKCSLYRMTLVADGIYLPVMIKKSFLWLKIILTC